MDAPILIGFTGSFSPIKIGIPLKAWSFEAIEDTQAGNCLPEVSIFVGLKEARKRFINRPPLAQRREEHSHGRLLLWQEVGKPGENHTRIESDIVTIQTRIRNVAIAPRSIEDQIIIQEIDCSKAGIFRETEMAT